MRIRTRQNRNRRLGQFVVLPLSIRVRRFSPGPVCGYGTAPACEGGVPVCRPVFSRPSIAVRTIPAFVYGGR